MATRTIAAAGGNWNAAGTWDEGVVPTAADDVVCRADGTSGNLTMNATGLLARSIDLTNGLGYSGLWTWNNSATMTLGTTSAPASNVALKCSTTMTTSIGASGCLLTFNSTVTGLTITTAGKSMPAFTFNGSGGGWTLQDTVNMALAFTVSRGTVDATGLTLNVGNIASTAALTRALNLTNATVNASTTGNVANFSGSALTLTTSGTTWNVTDTSAATKTFATGGFSFSGVTLQYTATGTGSLTVTGASTFAAIVILGHKLTVPASTTTTIAAAGTFRLRNAGSVLFSSTGGTAATLSVPASATVDVESAVIQDSTATGGATFQAVNSANVSGNTGWTFARLARGPGINV